MEIQIVMPSVGDMELVSQDGGVIALKPVFFGGECAGPIIRVRSGESNISYRLKIRNDGKIELKKADSEA